MPILTKEVKVKLWGKSTKYYNDLGYEGKHGDIIVVNVNDLPDGSNYKIEYLCDYCEDKIITIVYADYIRRKQEVNKMACRCCSSKKGKETCYLRYGNDDGITHYSQTQEFKEKRHNTCVERYGESYHKQFMQKAFDTFYNRTGYNYPSQSPDVKEKIVKTCIDHYGVDRPQRSSEVRKKTENTNLDRYGYIAPSKNKNVKEKMYATNLQKRGVKYTMQSPEVRIKANKTLCENGGQKISKQQLYLHELYGGKINFPISYYAADICFPEEKLVIEYDGGGHNLQVILGKTTKEEFEQNEIKRYNTIKYKGYKQVKIISSKDFLPNDLVLFRMLEYARKYFSNYSNHSWMEFNIDTSYVYCAEYRDGIYFDYGELRKIKDSDLNKKLNTIVV